MEDLTNIRIRIKAGKRLRSRLHGWPWAQLQAFIEYKARAEGINVVYINPAYTSKTCAACGAIGSRSKHRFTWKLCGIQRLAALDDQPEAAAKLMKSAIARARSEQAKRYYGDSLLDLNIAFGHPLQAYQETQSPSMPSAISPRSSPSSSSLTPCWSWPQLM